MRPLCGTERGSLSSGTLCAITSGMRSPLLFFLALFVSGGLCGKAFGQEQEGKLMNRLLRPNLKQSYLSKGDFSNAKSFSTGSALVKTYNSPEKFRAKDFIAGTYVSQKGYWMGDFKFKSTSADTKGRDQVARSVKAFDTKTSTVKSASDGGKNYAASSVFGTKTSGFRGRSQDKFDRQGPGALAGRHSVGWHGPGWQGGIDGGEPSMNMAPLSVDQVRDLLNKSK